MTGAAKGLRRQDSNLVQVSQSHRCCRYTTPDRAGSLAAHDAMKPAAAADRPQPPRCPSLTDTVGNTPARASARFIDQPSDRWLPAVTVSDIGVTGLTRPAARGTSGARASS